MKLLYITDCLYIPMSGARDSSLMHLKTLRQMLGKDNVTVIVLTKKDLVADCPYLALRSYHNPITILFNTLMGYPTAINAKIVLEIVRFLETHEFDCVFIDNSFFGRLTKAIKKHCPHLKVITYYHDVKQELCRAWIKQYPKYKLPAFWTIMRNERLNQKYSDVNLTLNARESMLFEKYYKRKPEGELPVYLAIPNDSFARDTRPMAKKMKILFVGAYYYPNILGIKWFVKDVLPLLTVPVQLDIVGRGMDQLPGEMKFPENVKATGAVESVAPYYIQSDLVIGPIFDGGGMKVKTAEAFGFGKVYVGTQESFEGYEHIFENTEKDYAFKCKNAQEFSNAITRIAGCDYLKKYNPFVRDVFERYYSDKVAQKILSKVLEI